MYGRVIRGIEKTNGVFHPWRSSIAQCKHQNGLSIHINSPLIQRLFSCIGYSAVLTWRSRADAPFDRIYVDAAPFMLDLAGKRKLTQSSRLDVLASLSLARCPGTCCVHVPNPRRLAAALRR